MRPLIYIAGPYRADDCIARDANVTVASKYGLHFARRGWCPVVPHALTHKMDQLDIERDISEGDWLAITLAIGLRCDVAFFVPGWEESEGAQAEYVAFREAGIRCYMEDPARVPPAVKFVKD